MAGRRTSAKVAAYGLMVAAATTISFVRPRAVASVRAAGIASDVFALPPPTLLTALSLGYRSALADLLYTSTVVSYGIHGEEHRRFDFVGQYLDSVVALDPQFCQTYRYADTFIIYQPVGSPTPDDVRHARRLLEDGLAACPTDGYLWLSAGQFLAFIGVQFLTDDGEKEGYRVAGAKMLEHAAELVTENQNVQWQALAAAGIFTREGKREAAIDSLERVYNVTDDLEIKENVAQKLDLLREERREERTFDQRKRHSEAFNQLWQRDLPFVSRTGMLVVGPRFDPMACAGGDPEKRGCARSWAEWAFADSAR